MELFDFKLHQINYKTVRFLFSNCIFFPVDTKDIAGQSARGGQPYFISLIQKYICAQKYGQNSE